MMREINKFYPDARLLTDKERQRLCEMIHRAMLEIRILGWNGKAAQAASLADAFHNVPGMLWSEDFSLNSFRNFLEGYHQEYPESKGINYPKMFDRLFNEEKEEN